MRSYLLLAMMVLGSCWLVVARTNAQAERPPFDKVRLHRPLPQLFQADEIYVLQGELLEPAEDMIISADLQLLEGAEDYHKITEAKTHHGRFSLPLHFKYPGLYSLSLKINYQLCGTRLLKAVVPVEKVTLPLSPLHDLKLRIVDFQPTIIWQTQNELVELHIQQGERVRTFMISNQDGAFQIDPEQLRGFVPGMAVVRIRSARSLDGSYATKASDWGQWQELSALLVEYIPATVDHAVKFNHDFDPVIGAGQILKFNMTIQANFQPDAYVKRPDGRVDIVRLRSNKRLGQFSVGKDAVPMYPAGRCWLEYAPHAPGIYQLEINDAYGKALINIPFYCGNCLPGLPAPQFTISPGLDNFDLQRSRDLMVAKINALRQRLGRRMLILDPQLTALSQYYSDRMAKEHFCAHVAPRDGELLDARRRKFKIIEMVKENVAKAPTLDQALYNLMNSPAHYAAMIDSTMTRMGIGIAIDETHHFLLAQHFSTRLPFADQAEQFLASLFQKMTAIRKDLIRLSEPPDQMKVTTATYHATSPEKIEQLILSPRGQKIWRHPSVGAVYFASLVQTTDGFKLEIDYYPKTTEQ